MQFTIFCEGDELRLLFAVQQGFVEVFVYVALDYYVFLFSWEHQNLRSLLHKRDLLQHHLQLFCCVVKLVGLVLLIDNCIEAGLPT